MTMATFHTLNNPAIYKQLTDELEEKFPNQVNDLPYLELEKLPYLVSYTPAFIPQTWNANFTCSLP